MQSNWNKINTWSALRYDDIILGCSVRHPRCKSSPACLRVLLVTQGLGAVIIFWRHKQTLMHFQVPVFGWAFVPSIKQATFSLCNRFNKPIRKYQHLWNFIHRWVLNEKRAARRYWVCNKIWTLSWKKIARSTLTFSHHNNRRRSLLIRWGNIYALE